MTVLPSASPSTAALATASADFQSTVGSIFSASCLAKPAASPKPVSTGPGQSVAAETPVRRSSAPRLCVYDSTNAFAAP